MEKGKEPIQTKLLQCIEDGTQSPAKSDTSAGKEPDQ